MSARRLHLRFHPGRCVATPGALEALEHAGQEPTFFLDRHVCGDWGECCPDDAAANEAALQTGARLLSVYRTLRNTKIWIITEAVGDNGRRASTCILLPEEY
jgi:hypothetical protein